MDSSKNCTRTKGRLVISFDHLHIISYENFRLWLLLLHVEIEEVVRKQKYFDHIEMKTFFLGFDFLTYFVGFEIACFETCRPVGRLALSLAGYQRVSLTHFQYSQYLAQPPTFDRFPLSWMNRGLICRSDSIYWLWVLWDCLLHLYSCPSLKSHQESFQEFAINPGKLCQTNITSPTTSKSIS